VTYWERLDAENTEREKSRMLALGRTYFASTPIWARGLRLGYSAGRLRWRWTITEGWHGRVVGRGHAWTLGGVFRSADKLTRGSSW